MSGLSKGKNSNKTIWMIVDRLTKSTLFLPMKMTNSINNMPRRSINSHK